MAITFFSTTIAGGGSFPSEDDVRFGVAFGDGLIGNLVLPTEAQVEEGVGFGANGTEFTGTLTGGGGDPLALLDANGATILDANGAEILEA